MGGQDTNRDYDVIVVGAGFAGLSAATRLETHGFDVQVIEATDRIGGRVWTVDGQDGRPLERGGQFINADMPKILAHIRRAELSVSSTALGGSSATFVDGRLCAAVTQDPFAVLREYRTPTAGQSVGDILAQAMASDHQRKLTLSMACELLCAHPNTVSASAAIVHAAGYHSQRSDMDFYCRDGLSALARHMVAGLTHAPILEVAVEAITIKKDTVRVQAAGKIWTARNCILAMTPPVAGRIDVAPGWPPFIADALAGFRPGAVIKTVLSYATPFWRSNGWSGFVQFAEPAGMTVVDGSRDDGVNRLVVFQGGPAALAVRYLTPSERQEKLVALLAAALGPQALATTAFDETVWIDDAWCGGGYVARVGYAGPSDCAARLRNVSGPVLFACSEISDHFPGFVEGAIAAGERAADQIMAQGRHRPAPLVST